MHSRASLVVDSLLLMAPIAGGAVSTVLLRFGNPSEG